MNLWQDQHILITGGFGFAGSHLVEALLKAGAHVRVVDNLSRGTSDDIKQISKEYEIEFLQGDLTDIAVCEKACDNINIVFHLAAKIRGIGYNVKHQGEMFYVNASINSNMLEAAKRKNVSRYLYTSTVGIYSGECRIPTPEDDGFVGEPEQSGYGYGWAKRMGEIQAKCYADEFGMPIAIIRPWNVFGPRDDFNLATAPVIPSLIRKVLEQDKIEVWGTGEQTRTFTYVEDFVKGAMLAVEKHPVPDPLNIGSNEEISIKNLLYLIIELTGRNIEVTFDESKPSGAPRRCPDITKAKKIIGYEPEFSVKEGLKKTIEWHLSKIKK